MDFETPPRAPTRTVIAAYVPHKQRVSPSQVEIIDELEQLVLDVPRTHALHVLGDLDIHLSSQWQQQQRQRQPQKHTTLTHTHTVLRPLHTIVLAWANDHKGRLSVVSIP
eukprot:COSAG01_NODE_27301_length_689_cov_0.952542_1_plen_109_part_10